nr:hypothetical protein [Tanacetum cinerariifolium]
RFLGIAKWAKVEEVVISQEGVSWGCLVVAGCRGRGGGKRAGRCIVFLFKVVQGLSQVEARLVELKNQEIKFCEKIRGLEFNVDSKNYKIKRLTNEVEQLKKEKEGLDSKLTGFESASKDLDTLLGSQRTDKNKEGLGYSIVPPPAQVYFPPKKDISWTGLLEFVDDTITDYNSLHLM